LNGSGRVVEYAVKMRQFEQEDLLSSLARTRRLCAAQIDEMTGVIANFHGEIQKAGVDSSYGGPEQVIQGAGDNFDNIQPYLANMADRRMLEVVQEWTEQQGRTLKSVLQGRKERGFVRECHGDLHLGNMAVVEGRITPFDCIEFNERLRWIDVMSEVAFVFMDLRDRGYPRFAYRFLNRYLQLTGDYAGIVLLRYYSVYRAMVRAKVAVLRLWQKEVSHQQEQQLWTEYQGYIHLAQELINEVQPRIVITHGVTGSGKTTVAGLLAEVLGAVHIRSDVERKRLYGYRADADTGSGLQSGIYDREAGRRTYECLENLAAQFLESGYPAIIDATFLDSGYRSRFSDLARSHDVPFTILDFQAPPSVLRERVLRRKERGTDASEADASVLELQLQSRQALSESEGKNVIELDVTELISEQQVADLILHRAQ
jgi:aminoglycoside phosphotransferase family enzyme/gluconate kinase